MPYFFMGAAAKCKIKLARRKYLNVSQNLATSSPGKRNFLFESYSSRIAIHFCIRVKA